MQIDSDYTTELSFSAARNVESCVNCGYVCYVNDNN